MIPCTGMAQYKIIQKNALAFAADQRLILTVILEVNGSSIHLLLSLKKAILCVIRRAHHNRKSFCNSYN